MSKWLILLSALSVTSVSGAPAWTWVDANGTVHFSDTPVPGAKQIELTGAQGFGTPPPPPTTAAPAGANPAPQTASPYRTFNIVSPAAQETLWNIAGNLNVEITIEPRLQANHRLDIVMDGQRRNLNVTGLQIALSDVFRGVHTMQAVVVDQRGMEISRSPATTFTVQQTSIQNPNAPLAPRPTPRGN